MKRRSTRRARGVLRARCVHVDERERGFLGARAGGGTLVRVFAFFSSTKSGTHTKALALVSYVFCGLVVRALRLRSRAPRVEETRAPPSDTPLTHRDKATRSFFFSMLTSFPSLPYLHNTFSPQALASPPPRPSAPPVPSLARPRSPPRLLRAPRSW